MTMRRAERAKGKDHNLFHINSESRPLVWYHYMELHVEWGWGLSRGGHGARLGQDDFGRHLQQGRCRC